MENNSYNPDVLNCLANLSNDEVFTPPTLANQMIDLLPQELFSDPKTTFLDPFCKSGVFLREIVKRLDRGLQNVIPDRRERIDHIMHKQVFGIAITELTSLLSRRSLYCSKHADGEHSVSRFDTPEGNLRYTPLRHTWERGKCRYCGASQEVYDRGEASEQYAYQFIHTDNPERIFNMKFDVIIGNPPYQLSDGGNNASAKPIYQLFVKQAKRLNPRYLTMIIPARWYSGGKGLEDFRNEMLRDTKIRYLVDYFDANDCFPGIDISGGVCYFLWNRDNAGKCLIKSFFNGSESISERPLIDDASGAFIRFNSAVSIIKKITKEKQVSFASIVSSRKPFGMATNVKISTQKTDESYPIFAYPNNGYVLKNQIIAGFESIGKYKVFIAKAYGERGNFPYLVLGKPFIGLPQSCCSETYLKIGDFKCQKDCDNIISYIKTKFFRFLVLLKKNTQDATQKVYQFVPIQDFSHPWTDEMLYKKYKLTEEEIAFIESMIRPME